MSPAQAQLLTREDLFSTLGAGLQSVLPSVFPTTQEETRLEKVRRMMGEDLAGVNDSELEVYLTEFNFLLDSWLDNFEQETFEGKTLQEVLREG